jgi:hypothetical protein
MSHDDWNVLAHGPLERLAENLHRVEGAVPRMSLRRNMLVVRMGDGRLLIHNAIATDDATRGEIEALGTPAFLVVPNGMHRLDAPAYKKRYPALTVLAPRGSRAKVEEKLPVDGTLEDLPADDRVRFEPIDGLAQVDGGGVEGAMLVRSDDGVTIVLNDIVFNMDRKRDLLGFLFTTVMGSAPGPRVSRLAKLALVKDKKALRANLERLAATPDLVRLVVAHEKVARGPDAAAALKRAATYL